MLIYIFRKSHYYVRVACFLLAVHFLNFSIDPVDLHPNTVPEDFSVNDIESFTELVAEDVLGYEDCFAEHEEADDDKSAPVPVNVLKYICYQQAAGTDLKDRVLPGAKKVYFVRDHSDYAIRAIEISSPPPEAIYSI